MKIIEINQNNIDDEHICCAIGKDKDNIWRANCKKEWMKTEYQNGLRFKRIDDRGKVFVEYMPIENCWKPVDGKNLMMINCLWVSGKFKGQGWSSKLLDEVIKDAKSSKMDGIAVISSKKKKPFLTDKKFYIYKGFEVVDKSDPFFELLLLKFNDEADIPKFNIGEIKVTDGFYIEYSNQCPFMEAYVNIYEKILKDKKIDIKIEKFNTSEKAQKSCSAFGTFGLFYNGEFVTHELMSEKKFNQLLKGMNL